MIGGLGELKARFGQVMDDAIFPRCADFVNASKRDIIFFTALIAGFSGMFIAWLAVGLGCCLGSRCDRPHNKC